MLVYVAWVVVDSNMKGKLHMVDSAALRLPGILFLFFLFGQVNRAIGRYKAMKAKTAGINGHLKTLGFMLTTCSQEIDNETSEMLELILKKVSAANMLFFMSVSEDRYLDAGELSNICQVPPLFQPLIALYPLKKLPNSVPRVVRHE